MADNAPSFSISTLPLQREASRRRTFAIISHPDAGKTTLTEKLLLYAGAIHLAGAVHARKQGRRATSDWMAIEQTRGISITSTALQFDYAEARLNLLDTPGHQDFSEDTYRTLMAVDSAIMVLDRAKGIEPQTRKLFEVCRSQHLPLLTFLNKMDHAGRTPLDLLDEIEQTLALQVVPLNWPVGDGSDFLGVVELPTRRVLLYERTAHGEQRAPCSNYPIEDPAVQERLGPGRYAQLREELDLVSSVYPRFDADIFASGRLTPVFFGSALINFGLEPLLDALVTLSPPPRPRESTQGAVDPASEVFSAFVFKIQANLDPQHRDRMAFLRICSGRFQKDMNVYHPRLQRTIRMTRPHRLFGRERETIEEAFAGDVIGVVNPGVFVIGDTIASERGLQYHAIPRFEPECFASLRFQDLTKHKQFTTGLRQLEEEGVIQVLIRPESSRSEPVLAAVGPLQFDVVVSRLLQEYGVKTSIEPLPFTLARRVDGPADALARVYWPSATLRLQDHQSRLIVLFASTRILEYFLGDHPDLTCHPIV